MPETIVRALANHEKLGSILPADLTVATVKKCYRSMLMRESTSMHLATHLPEEGAKSFVKSWDELMSQVASKGAMLRKAGS